MSQRTVTTDESIPVITRTRLKESASRGTNKFLFIVPAPVVLMLGWLAWANLYTEWLWFQSLGFERVLSATLAGKFATAAAFGLLAAAFVWLNLRLALRLSPEPASTRRVVLVEGERMHVPDFAGTLRHVVVPASLAAGLLAALTGWGAWDTLLRYLYQVPYGEADPVFGRDLSYYLFTLPTLEVVSFLLLALSLVGFAGAAVFYGFRPSERADDRRAQFFPVGRGARAHLWGLVALFFLLLAWRTSLAQANLLYSETGPVAGASYTDLAATLPALWLQLGICLVVAALAVVTAFRRGGQRLLLAGVAAYLVAVVGGGWLYPSVVQRFSVAPNELAKETPYIERNIEATREAFGLTRVEERELSGEQVLTADDVRENRRTINNIRLWDQQPLLDTFAQIQEIRTYYEFQSVDNDRYVIGGEPQQVMLSPRELSSASLPNRNWINERLTFTHGYGVTVGPVDKVTPEGLPELYVKDIPPASAAPELRVERPEIYFGEMSNDRVYVRTRTEEFNHPAGEQNVFRGYTGEGGVSIGSTWRQLLFATRFGDLKLLLSDDLTAESRVLYVRNIRERLERVAPYLRFDADPYMVISGGRLYWIADAYTTSDRYPYAERFGGVNYIRNSVKAVVDAYDGRVTLYLADERDPVIRTYARAYPGTLRPLAEMPEGLREHLRYPEDIFRLQAQVYSAYHMDEPQVFYNKEDQWAPAAMPAAQGKEEPRAMEPYYTIMKLPGGAREEFILMLPLTPQRKDNLAAWMVARSDGEDYGKLAVYRFPKQKLVFGPKQVAARINQDPEISRQLALWNQRGSQVILGTLMVIPVEESLIYVQPLYLRAQDGRIPELRRVIVAADNRIAMEPTLEASLARVFGEGATPAAVGGAQAEADAQQRDATTTPASPAAGENQTLAERARGHYERALQAQREGDWARYGEELKRLGETLEQMSAR